MRGELRRGFSPRRNSAVRKLWVIAASATSLSVTPKAWHTVAMSSSETLAALYRHILASGPCSDDGAAGASKSAMNSAAPIAVRTAEPVVATDARQNPPIQVSGLRLSAAPGATGAGGSFAARMSLANLAPLCASERLVNICTAAIPSAMQ